MSKISERLSNGGLQNEFLRFSSWVSILLAIGVNLFSRNYDLKMPMTLIALVGFLVLVESYWGRVRTVEILAEEEVAPLEEKWSTVYLAEVKNGHGVFLGETLEDAVEAEEKARQELDIAWSAARREWNSYGRWKKKMLEFKNLDEREFCRNWTGVERRTLWQAQARWEGLRVVESIMKHTLQDLEKD